MSSNKIKELIYKSIHRGCKEIDYILNEFVMHKLLKLNDQELKIYEKLLDIDDYKIYSWLIEKSEPPKEYISILQNIRSYHANRFK